MTNDDFAEDVTAVAALAEPIRRDLYAYIGSQNQPVSRDQAAAALSLPRHTVKFHLDRLVDEGLLTTEFRRLSGLSGPGAGRPSKLYRRSNREVELSLPGRDYRLAAEIMAAAIERSAGTGEPVRDATRFVALAVGRAAADSLTRAASDPVENLLATLTARGYEPHLEDDRITMTNCPFHQLARQHTELVCTMNLDLLDGLLEGAGDGGCTARLDPDDARCCVVIDL